MTASICSRGSVEILAPDSELLAAVKQLANDDGLVRRFACDAVSRVRRIWPRKLVPRSKALREIPGQARRVSSRLPGEPPM